MVMGNDLLAILQGNAQTQEYYDTQPPMACPNDGQPLQEGPPSAPGVLYCPFDGWQYPRDFDPVIHSGM